MSVPMYFDPFFDDAIRDWDRHSSSSVSRRVPRMFDQHFGMGVRPRAADYLDDMDSVPIRRTTRYTNRSPVVLQSRNAGTSEITNHKDRVEMKLDVQHFTPDELQVKISDGHVIVEAKHEEKNDEHGAVSRQFTRKYDLPEDVDEDGVVSHLSKAGMLTITAPRKVPPEPEKPQKSVPLKVEKDEKK